MLKKIFAVTAVTILLLHAAFCTALIFMPHAQNVLIQSYAGKFYKYYALLGPFFSTDRIDSNYELTIRHKENNEWSLPSHPLKESFDAYNLQPWRYDRIKHLKYQGYLLRHIKFLPAHHPDSLVKSHELKELVDYLYLTSFLPPSADSIHLKFMEHEKKSATSHTVLDISFTPENMRQ